MNKLFIDRKVTKEKLDTMKLLSASDKKFLHYPVEGERVLVVNKYREIIAYLCLFNITEKIYGCFTIPSVFIKKYKFSSSRSIKNEFEKRIANKYGCLVQTISKNDKIINRWMRFLGFKKSEEVKSTKDKTKYFVWGRKINGC